MRVLFVVASHLDNAALLAREIEAGFGRRATTTVATVNEVTQADALEYDAIILGACHRDEEVKHWARGLGRPRTSLLAAYDVRQPGPVARWKDMSIALTRELRRAGGASVVRPRTFHEEFPNGPLLRGELGRAGRWGHMLGTLLGTHGSSIPPQGRRVLEPAPRSVRALH